MRGFFSFLSRRGTSTLTLADFAAAVSPEAARALRAEGVVRTGPLAPCPDARRRR